MADLTVDIKEKVLSYWHLFFVFSVFWLSLFVTISLSVVFDLLAHSFTYSFTYSFIHSFIHSFIRVHLYTVIFLLLFSEKNNYSREFYLMLENCNAKLQNLYWKNNIQITTQVLPPLTRRESVHIFVLIAFFLILVCKSEIDDYF